MKNWELEQYLRTVQMDYDYGKDKMSSFRRSYVGKEDSYVFMSYYDTISLAIKYIEELEAKVDELSYAQKIIDETKKQDGVWEYWAGRLARCPICGYEYTDLLECNNYCGNCGAKMSEEKKYGRI